MVLQREIALRDDQVGNHRLVATPCCLFQKCDRTLCVVDRPSEQKAEDH
jgi:hypothetical protein